jgi:NAD(P)-dependent dehydrogenase (short-subunit alcohol dehydrogenase family)
VTPAQRRGRLHQRSVLIARSRSRFGRAAVERFTAEGAFVHAHEGDAEDSDDRRAAVRAALTAHGRLDALVVPPPTVPGTSFLDASEHRSAVRTALRASFFLAQEAARAMPDGGRICVASPRRPDAVGVDPPAPATLIEGALVALVRLLAVELSPRGIIVNGVCPVGPFADVGAVAASLAFLASEDASYVCGACLPVLGPEATGHRPSGEHWGALSESRD